MTAVPPRALQLRSLVRSDETLELSLAEVAVPAPAADQVVVRIEAAPINPSDIGTMFAGADLQSVHSTGPAERPVVTATISGGALRAAAGRVGLAMTVGNEGAGVVVAAGSSAAAQALLGKTAAVFGGSMYAQYRTIAAASCLELPDGTLPIEGASCFVNPLTALGMVETMRREGYAALVHTAAASNLGQMLNKLCIEDGVPLVNIVRKPEQEDLLRAAGATYVCNSGSPSFMEDLIAALTATGATHAFDATGGGKLASLILAAMESALGAKAGEYSRYGSSTHKQVYIYGALDRGPTVLTRSFGMAWGVGGWLLTPFLEAIGPEAAGRLRRRVAAEVKTTFASTYTKVVSLSGVLHPDAIAVYGRQATGEKYLIDPTRG